MSNDIKILDALNAIAEKPISASINGGYDTLEILESPEGFVKPTKAEIDAKIIEIDAEYDAQEYSRKRQAEYPSIQECVHAILDDDLTALQEKRQDVKTKYPKS